MKKKMLAKKKEIRSLFKSGMSALKLARKFKLTEGGIRWHLNN